MSEITERLDAYKAGTGETWDEIFAWLTTAKFPDPKRYGEQRSDAMLDDWYGNDDGTWDEVQRAVGRQLTEDEYHQILVERDRLLTGPVNDKRREIVGRIKAKHKSS